MSSKVPPSKPSSENNPVNPYAVSVLGECQVASGLAGELLASRTFRLRMDWADRMRFLRAVGPLRVFAMAGGVVAVFGLYTMVSLLFTMPESYTATGTWAESVAKWSLAFVRGGMLAYVAWLQWKLADAIAATAGGRTGDMNQWSQLQLRLAWWGVAMVAISLVLSFWDAIGVFLVVRAASVP
jgi:hypothetical protein